MNFRQQLGTEMDSESLLRLYVPHRVKRIELVESLVLHMNYCLTGTLSLFQQVVELDLSTVVPCCSGPKRPHDKVAVSNMKEDFQQCLNNKVGFKVSIGL